MAELRFRLAGPMAGFGAPGSTRTYRPCAIVPGKEGLVGLLSAAFGYPKGDARIQELFGNVDFSVEVERVGERFFDWQSVHHCKTFEYNANGTPKKYEMQTADGRTYGGPCIKKEYVSDVSYIVTVYASEQLVGEIRRSLQLPVWPLYLGRKCCVADPIEILSE